MSIALAASWHPRGELPRFNNLLPVFEEAYSGIIVSLPPDADRHLATELERDPFLIAARTEDWSWGRYTALEAARGFNADRIQYADFDRLLRWIETRPEEWRATLDKAERCDCLIVGRTPAAYQTHPQALVQSEAISNRVLSYLLGMDVDVSAGTKMFSSDAARYVVENCRLASRGGHALGTDAEWPVVLQRAGFTLDYAEVEGLDWESADRFLEAAANLEDQRLAAEIYDANPQNWARRVAIAMEIVSYGLDSMEH